MTDVDWIAFDEQLDKLNRDEKFEMFKRLIDAMNRDNPNLKIRFLEEWKQIEKTQSDKK